MKVSNSCRLSVSAALLLFSILSQAQQSLQVLHHHVSPAVSSQRAGLVGSLPPEQHLNISIVLPLRNQNELNSLLRELYDPSSPNYHHFLSVGEFTERFGPTLGDFETAVAFAKASGFAVARNPANRMLVPVSGSVAQIEKAFHLSMKVYRHPTENRTFYSPDREPSLDLGVPVAHIAGLNNFSKPRPLVKKASAEEALFSPAVSGSGPGGSYLASDMRAAYYGAGTLTGSGQTVGLVEFDGYNISDVTSSFNGTATSSTNGSNYLLAYTPTAGGGTYHVSVNNVLLDGASVTSVSGDDSEEVLDIVQAIGMAPGLSQVRVYIGSNDADILNAMAEENIAKQLSISWTWEPDDPSTDDFIFQELAAQGQSVFAASGDSGQFDPLFDNFFPAEDAWVIAVGGTHLLTNSAGGGWSSETAWTDSGGGISPDGIPIPSWQAGVADSSNGGSTTLRNVPDVAAEADFDNYDCNMGVCQGGWGGTSFAAPRWAGFTALVNQQAAAAGELTVGFLNPLLYSIGESSSYNSDFHDITSGNNSTEAGCCGLAFFNAVSGYDLVTGWGSPTGQNLIDALAPPASANFQLSALPSSLTINPGASATTTITVHDVGGFTGNVNLAISGLPSGVSASFAPNSTTGTSALTLTVSSSAIRGSYLVTIAGTSGTLTATSTLALEVNAPGFSISPLYDSRMLIDAGASATKTIVVTDYAGFTGSVSLAVTSAPSGVSASWVSNPTTGSSVLTLTASNSASLNHSMVTITGASGTLTATTTIDLTVRRPDFYLNVSPVPLTIVRGGSATATATVVPNGNGNFSSLVTLSAPLLPPGVTATFNPNPTASTSVLTMTASSSAPLGTTPYVQIEGTGGGVASVTVFPQTVTAAPTPTFTLGVSPGSLILTPATSITGTVTVIELGGFTGSVSLSALGLPSGVTASFGTNPTTGSSVLTLTASNSAAAGVYDLTIRGISGTQTVDSPLFLTVNPAPGFTLSASPASVTLLQGTSVTDTITMTPLIGFTGGVSLSIISTLPNGVTASFSPNPTTGSSVLTLTAGSAVPSGNFLVIIAGTSGTQIVTTALALTVESVTSTEPSVNFGQVAMGAGSTQSLSFTVPPGLTLGSISAVTQGAPNLDFTVVPGGTTCASGTTATSCTVQIQFLPTAPGTRMGAVLLADQSINTLITVPVYGTGTGPMVAFGPGIISTVAGNGTYGYNGDNVPAISAELEYPADVTVDGSGSLYIADLWNNRIRKVTPDGTITTVAGNGTQGYNGDNIPATSAELNNPSGVAVDGAGNFYIADPNNDRVRKVTPDGTITTVAGNGTPGYNGDNIAATHAELWAPFGVAIDGAGNLYIADQSNDRIRKVTPDGTITTVAGNGTQGYNGDDIPGTTAQINQPAGVSVDGAGDLYVVDRGNNRVRKITPGGIISTVAGNGTSGYNGDNMPATSAGLNQPESAAVDGAGNLYIADQSNNRIRKVTPDGTITTLTATLSHPGGVALDGASNLYIAEAWGERIRKVDVSDAPSLTFASTNVGAASAAQDVTVLNLGNAPLAISSISAAANFSLGGSDTSCSSSSQTLAPAASCVLGIEFNPASAGSINGSVVLIDNALNASVAMQTIALKGTGLQGSQNITFPNPGTQTYGVAPITLTATAASGLAVSYSVTSGPAAVSGNTLTITGAGSVTIKATQSGNANYTAATPVSVSFTVNLAALTAVANNASVYFGAPIPTLTGTLTGVVAGDGITASYATTAVQGSAVGTYPITPTLNDPNAKLSNYSVTKTPGTLTITAPPVVTATQSSVNFGSVAVAASAGAPQTLSFTVPSGITLGSVSAVTQGAPNLDFTVVPGSTTCASGTTATTCTVQVQFLPTAPGTRLGGVVLSDQSGKTLLTLPLVGTGTGPMVAFGPGTITTVAGNGTLGYNGDNVAATSAELNLPWGVAVDGAGNLYIADNGNGSVRKVTPDGTITKVAGGGWGCPQQTDTVGDGCPATSAYIWGPYGVAVDGSGNLYIADTSNNRIRKVTPDGTITTVAGDGSPTCVYSNGVGWTGTCYGGDGGPATSAQLNNPNSIAVDGVGNLYIADTQNERIRKVTPGGTITTVAGNGTGGYNGDNIAATSAGLLFPTGVAVDGAGNLYIADSGNQRIRKVTPGAGIITTVAGNGTAGYNGDNIAATSSQLNAPSGIAVDGAGNLYIADTQNERIRKVTPGGIITTVAGSRGWGYSGDLGPATSASFENPQGIAVDGAGNLYIADSFSGRIRKVNASNPPPLTFASTNVGAASAAQDVTVINLGNAPLNIGSISTSVNFSLGGSDTSCTSTSQALAPAASCALGIEFNPTATGSISGSVTLTDNTLNASAATQTVDVQGTGLQGSQTITFPSLGQQTYGVAPITLTATASSGLAVSYSVASGPATVSGNTLTITGAGSVTVQATQAGNSNYSAATPVSVTFTVNPATQTIAFPNPGPQTYGVAPITLTATASSGLPVSYTVTAGPASVSGSTLTITGVGSVTVRSAQTGNANYTAATPVSVSFTVNAATPTISWATPKAITYGTALSATQLNAKVTYNGVVVTGTLVYTPATGKVLGAGAQTLSVRFTPTATTTYNPVTASVTLQVNQATPKVTWVKPVAITYGTALSNTQLSATASVPGSFAYSPSAGTVLTGGTQALSVIFTPTDIANYTTASAANTITVNKAVPTLTWPTPAAVSYGTKLSGTQLNATASVPGTFVYLPATGSIPAGGTPTLSVTFTPTDTTDFSTAKASVTLQVNSSTPAITWPTPAAITYGTGLSATQLNAKVTYNGVAVPGTLTYTPATGTVLGAGTHTLSVVFTPTSAANYNPVTTSVPLQVNQATPKITWAKPVAITHGTALSSTQLNATASVPGSFAYSPAAGTALSGGVQALSATFTPTDTANYTTASAANTITVNKAVPTVAWATPTAISYGTKLSSTQLNATASVPGSFAYSPAAGTVPAGGTPTLSVTFTPTDTIDYTTAKASVTLQVNKATPSIAWPTPAAIAYGTALSATQLNAKATYNGVAVTGTLTYTPATGTVLGTGTQTLSVVFTPSLTADYNPVSASVTLQVDQAVPKITWAAPVAINYGTALSSAQLGASTTVAGSFTYSPASGTVLGAGTQTLSATFTPSDTTDYASPTVSTTITVNKASTTTTITPDTPSTSRVGQAVTVGFSITGPGTPTGSVTVKASTGESCTGTLTAGAGSCSLTFAKNGSKTLTASYAGDSNFKSSVSALFKQTVQ